MYFVEPEKSHVELMPNSGLYEGEHLLYCKQYGLKFKIIKGYKCDVHENKYHQLIEDYWNKTFELCKDNDILARIKSIILIHIGCFQKCCDVNETIISTLCNADESTMNSRPQKIINNDLVCCFDSKINVNTHTRKPIAIQINNMMRRMIHCKRIEEGIADYDVISINTDSLTFINNGKLGKISNINNTFKGWKYQDFKEVSDNWYEFTEEIDNSFIEKKTKKLSQCVLHLGVAGCGKTLGVIKNVIPKLEEEGKTYLVVSANHSAIADYRSNNISCDVLQSYIWNYETPNVDVVIVDEIGLCGVQLNDVLCRFKLAGIDILSYGDFDQQYPVSETRHCDNAEYLDWFYAKKYYKKTNHRNNFTHEYYKSIQDDEVDVLEEVKKHNTNDYMEADVVICITNALCDEYNKKIMDNLKIQSGDIGYKCMCKTNNLLEQFKICNNQLLIVTKNEDGFITFDNQYTIPIKKFTKTYFKPAYARTLYNVQGKSFKSYHVPNEEICRFDDSVKAYTLISRLKQDIVRPNADLVLTKKSKTNSDSIMSFNIIL